MYSVYIDGTLVHSSDSEDFDHVLLDPVIRYDMGKAASFEFGLPVTNVAYDRVTPIASKVTVFSGSKEKFRGRILSITRSFDNEKKVSCESDMAYLVDSVIKNEKYIGTTHDFFRKIIEQHNSVISEDYKKFEVGEITIDDRELMIYGQSDKEVKDDGTVDISQIKINSNSVEWKSCYEYIDTYLISYCGGFLRVRHVGDKTYLDLLKDNYGTHSSQVLEFGKNLLDLEYEVDSSDLFTVLIPIGDENLTIASVNDGSIELVNEELYEKYGRIMRTNVFNSVSDPNKLLQNGLLYIQENSKIKETVTTKAVDMHVVDDTVDEYEVGMVVPIYSAPHGINREMTCIEVTLDLINPGNNEYVFGDPDQTLTQIFYEDKKKSGGGGGSEKKQAESIDTLVEEKFNAYLNVNAETGTVDLMALYDKINVAASTLDDIKYIFRHKLGLQMDAKQGTLDLVNIRSDVDYMTQELKRVTGSSQSSIHTLQLDINTLRTQMELVSSTVGSIDNKYAQYIAQILLTTDLNGARLDMVVGNTLENAKGIHLLTEKTDDVSSTVTEIDTDVTRIKSRLTTVEDLVAKAITTDTLTANGLSNLRLLTVTGTSIFRNLASFDKGLIVYKGSSSFNGNVSILQPFGLKVGGKEVATQEYIQNQGFATEDWVKSRGYLRTVNWASDVTNRPTMIEKWVMINGEKVWYWSPRP